ncbi:MAG: dihydroorotate dehydrogenase electron transfer subunit [Candidatus Thermoplasmatota archaeon]|jgi:dihydroorotate dehydrogenase electron transfer subunit|nr:dihydroorotate dehydrogenase electron transfer subunit [Candidatus Thermoplasmatota archaeon]
MNGPMIKSIVESRIEAKNIKTILFEYPNKMIPGQFFMIWIPGVDEIPMSVSYIDKKIKGITFKKVGEATDALFKLKKGDKIGVRGPYGNGFKVNGKRILFVGGGTGIGMLAPAVEEAARKNMLSTVVIGVKNKNELFFEDRFRECGAEVYVSTDDGSKGYEGFASDLAKKILSEKSFDSVLTCGPEVMMKKLLDISKNIPFQASLERYMKCGIGICGQCCIGEGLRVCKDGPVFDGETLKKTEDFGVYKRDAAGRKIKV